MNRYVIDHAMFSLVYLTLPWCIRVHDWHTILVKCCSTRPHSLHRAVAHEWLLWLHSEVCVIFAIVDWAVRTVMRSNTKLFWFLRVKLQQCFNFLIDRQGWLWCTNSFVELLHMNISCCGEKGNGRRWLHQWTLHRS